MAVLALTLSAAAEAKDGRLGHAGRWFTYDGRPVYLVGFDAQELACNPSLDYERALDEFARFGLNKVRVWVYCWFGTTSFRALTPWARDAAGRHDLDHFEERYWRRLRAFVASAERRRIVVEVSIFTPYPNRPGYWWGDPAMRNAWNRDHNVNGVYTTNAEGHFYPQFFDLDYEERGRRLRNDQGRLVAKTVAELGRFDNVYFEIANEFAVEGYGAPPGAMAGVQGWQLHWAREVRARTRAPIAAHADDDSRGRGARYFAGAPEIDVLNFRLADASPREMAEALLPWQQSGKVLTINEAPFDFYEDIDRATRYAWAMFMAGGHFAAYEDDAKRIGSPGWREMAKRLRVLRAFAEAVHFVELSPVDQRGRPHETVIRQAPSVDYQFMAAPGKRYVAYFAGRQKTASLVLALPRGRYAYRWLDVRDGKTRARGSAAGSGKVTIRIPAGTWPETTGLALVVERTGT